MSLALTALALIARLVIEFACTAQAVPPRATTSARTEMTLPNDRAGGRLKMFMDRSIAID
jgi:hypothetical protein